MEEFKVSVAMATYNGEKYLEDQLNSIILQDYKIFEIVIVDDCSTDNTWRILNEFSFKYNFIKIHKNKQNSGPINTFFKAIELTNGDYIALSDQDDIWMKNKISMSLNELIKNELKDSPCCVFTDLILADSNLHTLNNSFLQLHGHQPDNENFYTLLYSNSVVGCTILVNKEIKLFLLKETDDIIMHDHYIALICSLFGSIKFIKINPIIYRNHQQSVTNKFKENSIFKLFNIKSKINSYLKKELTQAILIKNNFKHNFDNKKLKILDYFINVCESGYILKKINLHIRYKRNFIE